MALSIAAVIAAGIVDGRLSLWIVVLNVLLGVLLPAWLLLGTDYVLDQEHLKIRCGPFRWSIPVREIRHVEPTRNPLSSPALSLDRLRIEYGNGKSLMISPRDTEQFLADLDALRKKR
jgi:hypothetical protein